MTNEIKIDAFLASDSDMREKKKQNNKKLVSKKIFAMLVNIQRN